MELWKMITLADIRKYIRIANIRVVVMARSIRPILQKDINSIFSSQMPTYWFERRRWWLEVAGLL